MDVCIFYAKTILFLLLDTHTRTIRAWKRINVFFSWKVCENFRWCPWKKDFQLNVRILKFIKMYICDDLKIMLSYIHDVCAYVFVCVRGGILVCIVNISIHNHQIPTAGFILCHFLLLFLFHIYVSVMCEMTLRGQMSQNVKYAAHFCVHFLLLLLFAGLRDSKRERTPLKMHLWRWQDNEHEHPLNIHIMNKKTCLSIQFAQCMRSSYRRFAQMLKNVDVWTSRILSIFFFFNLAHSHALSFPLSLAANI